MIKGLPLEQKNVNHTKKKMKNRIIKLTEIIN